MPRTHIQSFALVLTCITPPYLPPHLTPFRSTVHFSLTFVYLALAAIPLALSIGLFGRGVSLEANLDVVKALKQAGGGGLAGAAAMVLQVLLLMPMRTIMNYQYRFGGTIRNGVKTMWGEGGFPRFYAGLGAALCVAWLVCFLSPSPSPALDGSPLQSARVGSLADM